MSFPLESIDLNLLLKQLVACASKWFLEEHCFNPDDMLPATGKSATELAYDIVGSFLEGGIGIDRDPEQVQHVDVFRVLRHAMRNDFLDLVKQGRAYKRTEIYDVVQTTGEAVDADPGRLPSLDGIASSEECDFEALELHSVEQRIFEAIGKDPPLKEYVQAVLRYGCLKREDIAEHLGITPQEATNRRRRLRDRLGGWRMKISQNSKGYRNL